MNSLKGKAKTLNELFWENETEWKLWSRLGLTEKKQIELSPKYQEKWIRLEDAEQKIEKVRRKYEALISKAEKDCADCYQDLKQKLQQLLTEFPDINDKKYELPDGWTSQDIVDIYRIFFQDVFAWKRKLEELLKEERMKL
jgi:protein-arginine kinase activator protein McsA